MTQLSIADLAEVYEARLALEPLAVRRAAARFDAAWPRLRASACARSTELDVGDSPETWAAHTAFHFALYEAGDSSWLLRLIRPLWETSQRYRLAAAVAPKLDTRRAEHELILAACIEHDADRAAALTIRNHRR